MKKLVLFLFLLAGFMTFAQLGPITPTPVQKILLQKAYEYTDTAKLQLNESKAVKYEKIAPYLYKMQVNEFDWNRLAETYQRIDPSLNSGMCSSVRAGNIVGRNLDWSYDNTADIIVHTVKGPNVKHSVIGVATGVPGVEEGDLSAGRWSEKVWIAAHSICDGINDAGVVMNHNVVPGPTNDASVITYTNPGKKRLSASNVIRWVLNNADSASNACEIIKNEIDIFVPNVLHGYDSHWMINDTNKCYIAEIRKGQVIIIDVTDRPCMTNFRIEGTSLTNGVINIDTVERYAQGTERYNLFLSNTNTANTVDGMINLMNSYPYSMCYDELRKPDPFWYSDYVGNDERFGDLTIHSPTNAFDRIIAYYRQQYKNRSRSNPDCWQTVHATVYDMQNKVMYITPQESGEVYKFELNPYRYR